MDVTSLSPLTSLGFGSAELVKFLKQDEVQLGKYINLQSNVPHKTLVIV